jgi:hypothetical protein
MAVRKLDLSLPESRKNVALRNDPTRGPEKAETGEGSGATRSAGAADGSLCVADAASATAERESHDEGENLRQWEAYCDEAYAILSKDYLVGKRKTPEGFSVAQLDADLHDLQ